MIAKLFSIFEFWWFCSSRKSGILERRLFFLIASRGASWYSWEMKGKRNWVWVWSLGLKRCFYWRICLLEEAWRLGRERRYGQRWADQWPLENLLGPALPFSPQLENIPICPKLARDSSGPLSAPPPLISQLRTISSLIAGSGPADRSGHMYLIRRSWGLWNDKWGFSFQSSLCRILETAVGFGW